MTVNRKPLLLALAVTLLVWFSVAFLQWLGQADTFGARLAHAWQAATSDWLVAVVLADAAVFVALALAWLWRDAGARSWTRRGRIGWIVATLVLGSPALLIYLAFRSDSAAGV